MSRRRARPHCEVVDGMLVRVDGVLTERDVEALAALGDALRRREARHTLPDGTVLERPDHPRLVRLWDDPE